jgi:hypothetical protein
MAKPPAKGSLATDDVRRTNLAPARLVVYARVTER